MAQAARLSLRMHKELKLLLSDPPPGASFPFLSSHSDDSSASLTAIDAQIEGPKGTVYENGYFHIKIQIPERYPFQPPVVTFATPIYHPNIDTGGRICLDILNLPPKGAWQPSLNISTVITSIGLLLSEPNPDDGLMCEASKEYKYNKQAFDQKARSMTEKYAKALSSSSSEGIHINSNSNQGDENGFQNEVRTDVIKSKLYSTSRKLSLQSSGSTNSSHKRQADQPKFAPNSQIEMEHRLESKYHPCNSNGIDGKMSEMRKQLSLEGLCQSRKIRSDKTGTSTTPHIVGGGGLSCRDAGFGLGAKAPVCQKFPADRSSKMQYDNKNIQQVTQPASTGSCPNLLKTSSIKSHKVNCVELKACVEDANLAESKLTMDLPYKENPCSNKKLNPGYQQLEENTKENNKENVPQVALHQTTQEPTYHSSEQHLASSSVIGKYVSERTLNSRLNSSCKHQGVRRRLSLRPVQNSQANHESSCEVNMQNKGAGQRRESEVPISSEAIVMDSEDEEEKNAPISSKVMVPGRRLSLARKRKAR